MGGLPGFSTASLIVNRELGRTRWCDLPKILQSEIFPRLVSFSCRVFVKDLDAMSINVEEAGDSTPKCALWG